MIFEKLPLMGNPHRPMQLLVDFAEHIISLWTRCVEEQFWEPVKYLISLISFTFDLHTISVAPLVITNLAPIAQATIVTLAEGRRRAPDDNPSNGDVYSFLEEHIDTTQILSLLYTSAMAGARRQRDGERLETAHTVSWRACAIGSIVFSPDAEDSG